MSPLELATMVALLVSPQQIPASASTICASAHPVDPVIYWWKMYGEAEWDRHHGYSGSAPTEANPRSMFAPVFVAPTMEWHVPNSTLIGSPPPANLFEIYGLTAENPSLTLPAR